MFFRRFYPKKFVICIIFFQLVAISNLSADFFKGTYKSSDPYFLITIPKSGTFLSVKLMSMLLEKEERWIHLYFPGIDCNSFDEQYEMQLIPNNKIQKVMDKLYSRYVPFTHTNFTEPLIRFYGQNPQYTPILVIRDLRDILVSWVVFTEKSLDLILGRSTTINERIQYVLHQCGPNQGFVRYIEKAMLWIADPHVFVLRFEDIIGKKGGGSNKLQDKTIKRLAKRLKIKLSEEKLVNITQTLFGRDENTKKFSTFRSGQIGNWRKHFDEETKALFIEKMGVYQLGLGYTLD